MVARALMTLTPDALTYWGEHPEMHEPFIRRYLAQLAREAPLEELGVLMVALGEHREAKGVVGEYK